MRLQWGVEIEYVLTHLAGTHVCLRDSKVRSDWGTGVSGLCSTVRASATARDGIARVVVVISGSYQEPICFIIPFCLTDSCQQCSKQDLDRTEKLPERRSVTRGKRFR